MRTTILMTALAALAFLGAPALAQDAPAAPDFSLQDLDGKTWTLSELKDKVVVLEWTNRKCPYVVRHYKARTMQDLAERYAAKGVVWLSIDSSHFVEDEVDQLKGWKAAQKVGYPILRDASGEVGRSYKARTSPHMFIVKGGEIHYDGAIDDGPRGRAKVNHVEAALDEILAGKAVSNAKTRPYGCSVKYARGGQKRTAGTLKPTWHTSWDDAVALSKKHKRPILVDFTGSDWCGWCVKLKKEVFDTPHFKQWAAKNVVLLELDFPRAKPQSKELKEQNARLRDHYRVRGYPTILFLSADGAVIGRSGYRRGGPEAWTSHASGLMRQGS